MPKWKGKKVSNAHYFNLRCHVENKLVADSQNWGFSYKELPYKIGGKKNGKLIRKHFMSVL